MMCQSNGLPVEGRPVHMLPVGPPQAQVRQPPLKRSARSTPAWGPCVTPKFEKFRRSDLGALHRGVRNLRLNELIESHIGRIIFMDEFYSLIERHQDEHGGGQSTS